MMIWTILKLTSWTSFVLESSLSGYWLAVTGMFGAERINVKKSKAGVNDRKSAAVREGVWVLSARKCEDYLRESVG